MKAASTLSMAADASLLSGLLILGYGGLLLPSQLAEASQGIVD